MAATADPPPPVATKGEQTRHAVLQAAITRFGRDGYRATSVADSLIRAGVPAEKISVMGFGEQRPRESNRTPEGRSANRRVEVVFVVK